MIPEVPDFLLVNQLLGCLKIEMNFYFEQPFSFRKAKDEITNDLLL